MQPHSDDVLRRAVDGDRDALVTLFERYGPAVRRSLNGKIARRWRSLLSEDDVMQVTFAEAALGIQKLVIRSEAAFRNWLIKVADRNLHDAIKALQTDKRGGQWGRLDTAPGLSAGGPSDQSFVALYELLCLEANTPSRHVARGEARTALSDAIAALPETYAQVVRLYDLEGRSIEDVAETLNRSPGAVYMLRSRAHQRLHEIMGCTSRYFSKVT